MEGGLRQLRAWLSWQQAAGVLDLIDDPVERIAAAAAPFPAQLAPSQAAPAEPRQPGPLRASISPPLLPDLPVAEVPPPARRPETGDIAAARRLALACDDLEALERALVGFEGCALRRTATRLCFADGNPASPLVLVGEAPGAEEDRQGKPFVGPSGRLLDRMLATIGLDRSHFWITNCLFWRPPGNRTPSPQEVMVCQPFLERALELVQPRLVLFVGGTAARSLLGLDAGVTRLRGTMRSWRPDWTAQPIETLVTFHPAYLLRNPAQKKLVWRDLVQLRQRLDALAPVDAPERRPN